MAQDYIHLGFSFHCWVSRSWHFNAIKVIINFLVSWHVPSCLKEPWHWGILDLPTSFSCQNNETFPKKKSPGTAFPTISQVFPFCPKWSQFVVKLNFYILSMTYWPLLFGLKMSVSHFKSKILNTGKKSTQWTYSQVTYCMKQCKTPCNRVVRKLNVVM